MGVAAAIGVARGVDACGGVDAVGGAGGSHRSGDAVPDGGVANEIGGADAASGGCTDSLPGAGGLNAFPSATGSSDTPPRTPPVAQAASADRCQRSRGHEEHWLLVA